MSFVAVAIGGTVIAGTGIAVSAINGQKAAEAQGQIAVEQEARANQAMTFAAPTQDEITTLGNQIANYQSALSQSKASLSTLSQQLQSTYGSNILEMGQQLHDQLTGTDSGVVKAAQTQIDRQRTQLQQSLVDKMGPAALSSSAGIQAMNNFDLQANSYITNLRQNSVGTIIQNLSSMQGGESSTLQNINSINNNLAGLLNNIQQTQGGFQTRQANAALGTAQYQGGENVGAAKSAEAAAATGSQIANLGGTVIGAAIGAGAKKANPTAAAKKANPTDAATQANQVQPGAIQQNGFTAQDLSGGGPGSTGYTGADLGSGIPKNSTIGGDENAIA